VMRRRIVHVAVATTCAIAIGSLPLSGALGATRIVHRHAISETQHIAMVGSQGYGTSFRMIYAGTIDGTIGGRAIHGVRSAVVQTLKVGDEIVRGTEFDASGTRSFVLHNHYTIISGARTITHGSGTWTGGTGAYRLAHGSFTVRGTAEIGGITTIHLNGNLVY
jgi:hypothetical protein